MPVRTNQCLLGGPGGIAERCYDEGLITGFGDERLRVGPVKIFTDGSAGGRTDPTRIQCRDLSRTEHDALLSMIRRKLRGEFNFPRSKDRYFGVPAVYSLENVRYPQPDGTVSGTRPSATTGALKLDCDAGLGAAMHVTAAFAMVAVGKALDRLLEPEKPRASPPPTQE